MTREVTAWLPPQVAERSEARAPFDRALVAWRDDWLPNLPLRITTWSLRAAEPPEAADDRGWNVPRGVVAVSCSARATMRLVGAALDVDLEGVEPNARDRAVIEGVCDRLLADLAERFEAELGEPSKASLGGSGAAKIRATIGSDDGTLLAFEIPAISLIATFREALPPPRPAALLKNRANALAATAVHVEAVLGSAMVSLPDLRAMAPGDVLRLDRKLNEPANIKLVSGGGFVADAVLTQSDGHLALVIRPPAANGTQL